MALDCNTAFGRYMRMLRERKQLSLDEVESLSRSFPDPINKGYLSRAENGHTRMAFSKLIALSRIYEVPSDVLGERMELDMELDRIGGPETEGLTFGELYELGKQCIHRGVVWDAYAYSRDGVFVADRGPVLARHRDRTEQVLVACMNAATPAIKLGRLKFARHEFAYIHRTKGLGSNFSCLVLERLSRTHRELREFDVARKYLDKAIGAAEESGSTEWLGYMYSDLARLAEENLELKLASELYRKSYREFQRIERHQHCAFSLYHLARVYFAMKRNASARRAIVASERLARLYGLERAFAFLRILRGEIEESENNSQKAASQWREAVKVAKKNNDRLLRFKAELLLYRQALKGGNHAAARAIGRRLRRLSPWIPEGEEELLEFRRLSSQFRTVTPRKVSTTQPPVSSVRNP